MIEVRNYLMAYGNNQEELMICLPHRVLLP